MSKGMKYGILGVVGPRLVGVVVRDGRQEEEQAAHRRAHRGRAEARPRRLGDRQRPGFAAHEGRPRGRRQRPHRQARREGGRLGEGRATSSSRSIRQPYQAAVQRTEAARRQRQGVRDAGAGEPRRRRKRNYRRQSEIRKSNPNLVSDDQMEQLKTAVDVEPGALRRRQAQHGAWRSPRVTDAQGARSTRRRSARR